MDMPVTYYKVLLRADDGTLRSCCGSNCVWPEPRDGQPGDWLPPRPPRLYSSGYHLTSEPARWWGSRAECYIVEYDGLIDGEGHKIAVERARLVRRLTDAELAAVQIFVAGEHEVLSGIACAAGSATVVASGSARVVARGTSIVEAYGFSSVEAYDSSLVEAYDLARVVARDSASVTAYDFARVVARDSASVTARGASSVEACDSASVVARNYARVVARGESTVVATEQAEVALHENARCVDRRAPPREAT